MRDISLKNFKDFPVMAVCPICHHHVAAKVWPYGGVQIGIHFAHWWAWNPCESWCRVFPEVTPL